MVTNRAVLSRLTWSSALVVGGLTFTFLAPAHPAAPSQATAARPAASSGATTRAAPPENAVRSVVPSGKRMKFLTESWTGERYADGRPKVSDEILKRMKNVSIEQAWGALKERGYNNQYAGNWKKIHTDRPIVGRVLTAQYMPSSPALEKRLTKAGHEAGRDGQMNTWPIEMLENGDVYVADGYGKVSDGTLIGGNLGTEIHNKTGNGVVLNGSLRDLGELEKIKGFNAFVRDWHPSYIQEMMLTGINVPLRIGKAVVLPGDVVLARREGVVFIPAHLTEEIVKEAEVTLLRDRFTKQRLKEGTYTSGQLDKGWDEVSQEIKNDYRGWLTKNKNNLPVPPERVQEIIDAS